MEAVNKSRMKMIALIKKYSLVSLVSTFILVLLVLRLSSGTKFRPDAEKHSQEGLSGSNIVDKARVLESPASFSIINLEHNSGETLFSLSQEISIDPGDILDKDILNTIKGLDGSKVLVSNNIELAARSWVLLSQKGIKDLFIMSDESTSEEFKYKFRPITDSSAPEPEFD